MTSITATSIPITESSSVAMPQERSSTRITGAAARAKFVTRPIRVIVRAASPQGIDRNGNEIFSNADIELPPEEGFWSYDRVRNCSFYTFTHTASVIIGLAIGFFIVNYK